jgi:hypothetical protein
MVVRVGMCRRTITAAVVQGIIVAASVAVSSLKNEAV